MQNSIREYLIEHNYFVLAKLTDNGCIFIFPPHYELPITPSIGIKYNIKNNKVKAEYSCDHQHNLIEEYTIPKYAIRPFLMFILAIQCQYISYKIDNIIFLHNQTYLTDEEFFNQIPINMNSKENNKSQLLAQTFSKTLSKNIDQIPLIEEMKKNNIYEGYLTIKKLLLPKENENE
jgi:hypothetical protein